jgi:hypothetical protein
LPQLIVVVEQVPVPSHVPVVVSELDVAPSVHLAVPHAFPA